MSYDPKRKSRTHRHRHDPKRSARRMFRKLVHRGPRGGTYFQGPSRRRYDPGMSPRRRSYRRRHDPARRSPYFGRSTGILTKLLRGVLFSGSAVVGSFTGGYVKGVAPMNLNLGSKAINIPSFAGGAMIHAFAPSAGYVGDLAQGFAGGLAGSSDPPSSILGGGSVQYQGTSTAYGSIGV